MRNMFYALFLIFCAGLFADISPFEQTILDRNGDVYVLVTSATGTSLAGEGLYKFTRMYEYAVSKLGNTDLNDNITNYSGLSVDKFGHISLFRDEGDGAPVGLLAELSAGTVIMHPDSPESWPGLEDVCWDDSGGVPTADCGASGAHWRKATPPGWAYVVEPNGKYGWYKMYDWTMVGLTGGTSFSGHLYDSPATFPDGTEIIPQATDVGINTCNGWNYHGGDTWWNGPTRKASYAFGLSGGGAFHPPINSFWSGEMVHRGGRRIAEVEKSVTALYMDKYLTAKDNKALYDARDDTKFALEDDVDYFNSGVGDVFDEADNALNTSLSFAQEIKAYNHCYDMCGQGAFDVPQAPIVINEGRAKFSSGGNSAQNQRSYMIKTASRDQGTRIETSVVSLTYDPATNSFAQADIVIWDGGFTVPSGDPAPKYSTDSDIDASAGSNVIVYKFADYPEEFARSVQTSRRVKGGDESKDYIYISNAPFSHFNVSESFWGTGGVAWWAKEIAGRKLELHYEQRNHQVSGNPIIMNSGTDPVVADEVEALQAIGADGDNFIYILHAGEGSDGAGGVENEEDMVRILTPLTKARIDELSASGKLISPPAFPISGPACVTMAGPCEASVTLKISAGLVLEKIAPLAGSKPSRLGIVPLEETGKTCQAVVLFPEPTGTTPGSYKLPFTCEVATAAGAVENFNIEMSVINVANPPATGGDSLLDITALRSSDNAREDDFVRFVEDTEYLFNMENPPNFNGSYAQLGVTDPTKGLTPYGLMQMISNYDVTGIELLQTAMVPGSLLYDKYFNDDTRVGRLLASFINDTQKGTKLLYEGADQMRTLRYRWRVIAKTPPHSLKNYSAPVCDPLLNASVPISTENQTLLKNLGYLDDTTGAEPLNSGSAIGIMYDSCWHDMADGVPVPGMSTVVAPPELDFTFTDPGEYEVQLMTGGKRFNADQLTFLSKPDSVNAQVYVTWYAKQIHVGAKVPEGDDAIRDVVIANNDLGAGIEMRSGIYSNLSDMRSNLTSDGALVGPMGRFPVLPSYNYPKTGGTVSKPLLVTYEQQRTPIVAEAEIEFFRIMDTVYLDFGGGTAAKQSKNSGVGAWDYSYPGDGTSPVGSMNNISGSYSFTPVNKFSTHPPNWNSVSADKIVSDELTAAQAGAGFKRYGYDASGDPLTGRGVDESGVLLTETFIDAHQGTLAHCNNFPAVAALGLGAGDSECFIRHPESMYNWWEIKYAWFMRYTRPNGDEVNEVIKTGNLAEIFALNLYARYRDDWKHLVRNLAPDHLLASGTAAFDDNSLLMKNLGSGKFRVRIPLISQGAILTNTGMAELQSPLQTLNGGDDFATLFENIHPPAFNVPSEPTIIEIGIQLFFPKMDWAGRDLQGTNYAYYDAVYYDDGSGYACNEFTPYVFDAAGPVNAWPRFANTRGLGAGPDTFHTITGAAAGYAGVLGLQLAQNTGGFTDGAYTAPGNGVDDFVDIVVLDLKTPLMRVLNGGALSANAGGKANDDILLEVEDNNPYAIWNSYDEVGDLTDIETVPSLVHFAYEIGPDPRNQYGIGLIKRNPALAAASPDNAYGFNLSHSALENIHDPFAPSFDLPQFKRSNSDSGASYFGTPHTVPVPGYVYPQSVINSTSYDWFYYPHRSEPGGDNFPVDGFFVLRDDADDSVPGVASHNEDYNDSWERFNTIAATDYLHYYMPDTAFTTVEDAGVRVSDGGFYTDDMPYRLLSFVPPNNVPPYNLDPDYPDGERIEFVDDGSYDRYPVDSLDKPSCLSIKNPLNEDPDDCKIRTRWLISGEHIIAPYFMDGTEHPLVLNTYAKARDVRISVDLPPLHGGTVWSAIPTNWYDGSFGTWPSYMAATAFARRIGMENTGLDADMGTEAETDMEGRISKVFNSELQRRANQIGTLTVTDNSPPNFRVIITEFKNRTQTEFIVMGAQGFDASVEPSSSRVFYFKTPDPRGEAAMVAAVPENAVFTSSHKTDYSLTEAVAGDLKVNELAGSAVFAEQAYLIPEDVRFEIRVQAGDNRDLDRRSTVATDPGAGSISIKVSGGHAAVYARPGSFPVAQAMDSIFELPLTETMTGRVYQQMKFASVYHHYPRAGYYDVIEVEVSDSNGNLRRLYIPIEVISQSVMFRQIGSDMQRR